jgi:hypothetical protein
MAHRNLIGSPADPGQRAARCGKAPPSQKLASLAVQRAPCPTNPLSMAVEALSMSPTAPGRRFDAAAPGPRRVVIISEPTGGRRCLRHGTLLKRGPGVRSSWSRSGSSNGLPRPGAARELPLKNYFKGEASESHHQQKEQGDCALLQSRKFVFVRWIPEIDEMAPGKKTRRSNWVYAPISPANGIGSLRLLGNPNNTSP